MFFSFIISNEKQKKWSGNASYIKELGTTTTTTIMIMYYHHYYYEERKRENL